MMTTMECRASMLRRRAERYMRLLLCVSRRCDSPVFLATRLYFLAQKHYGSEQGGSVRVGDWIHGRRIVSEVSGVELVLYGQRMMPKLSE